MKLLCDPYRKCETNADQWMLLSVTPERALELLSAAMALSRFRPTLAAAGVQLETPEIEIRVTIDLCLFDDGRLNLADDSAWCTMPDDFEPDEDNSTRVSSTGARFTESGVVLVLYPEHYKGSAESVELTTEQLEQIAKGISPFASAEIAVNAE